LRGSFPLQVPQPEELKAGEGNRTLVCSLGSCRSTIELHPQRRERANMEGETGFANHEILFR
jgi:hypothetical protein